MPELKHWSPALRLDKQLQDSLRLFEKFNGRNSARSRLVFIQKWKTLGYRHKCSYSANHLNLYYYDCLNNFSGAWHRCPRSWVCVFSFLQACCPLPKLLLLNCAHLLLEMWRLTAPPQCTKSDFYGWHGYICKTLTFCLFINRKSTSIICMNKD